MANHTKSRGLLRTMFGGSEVIEPGQRSIIVAVLLGMLVGAVFNAASETTAAEATPAVAALGPDATPAE